MTTFDTADAFALVVDKLAEAESENAVARERLARVRSIIAGFRRQDGAAAMSEDGLRDVLRAVTTEVGPLTDRARALHLEVVRLDAQAIGALGYLIQPCEWEVSGLEPGADGKRLLAFGGDDVPAEELDRFATTGEGMAPPFAPLG